LIEENRDYRELFVELCEVADDEDLSRAEKLRRIVDLLIDFDEDHFADDEEDPDPA